MEALVPKKVIIKVPGKLFIAGEYAVTRQGGRAIVAAVETNFMISVKQTKGLSVMHTNIGLEAFSFKPTDLLKPGMIDMKSDWSFALTAIKKFIEVCGPLKSELEIEIQSNLGYGKNKKGYGSSAAVVSGIVKALNQFFNMKLSFEEEFEIAADAHFEVQGSGSMGDIAAIIFGGIVSYRNRDLIEVLQFPDWETFVVQTGKSVKTGEKLSINFEPSFYAESDKLVQRLSQEKNFSGFKKLLLENQDLLIKNLPKDYVTEKLDFALKTVNSHPRLAGKISGSGFGENLIVFSNGVSWGEITLLIQSLEQKNIKMEAIKFAKSN